MPKNRLETIVQPMTFACLPHCRPPLRLPSAVELITLARELASKPRLRLFAMTQSLISVTASLPKASKSAMPQSPFALVVQPVILMSPVPEMPMTLFWSAVQLESLEPLLTLNPRDVLAKAEQFTKVLLTPRKPSVV